MSRRNFRRGSNAIIYTALTIGILVLINVIASRSFSRVDLTEDKVFTISDASKKLVASLPDRLTIKAFISSDLPPQVQGIARYLRDMLEEYATYSKGKVIWEALDPSRDDKIKEEASRLKVRQAQLSVFEKSKASVSASFLGVAFQYGGKVESLPFVSNISNLEYQISSTIRRLTSKKKKVGLTSGHGEPSLHQELRGSQQVLMDFEVTTVDLAEGKKPIPDDVDLLVMVGPTKQFSERAKYEIDQFLMKGKGVAIFIDGMTLETPRGQMPPGQMPPRIARANQTGLDDQLEYYGVKLQQDLIMDQQNQRVVLPAGQGQRVITNYPAFPIVTNLSREVLITKGLKAYVSIFSSSLEPTTEALQGKSGVKATVLAQSSRASWKQTGFFLFDPLRKPEPTKETGPFNLAVLLQGSFKSFFAGKPVPSPGPPKPPSEKEVKPSGDGPKSPSSTRLVVVGDSDLIKDQFLGLYKANLLLLANTVDYLAQDESLIAIREKGQTRRPLQDLEDGTVATAKWVNIVGLPVVFVAFGLVRWRWRKRSRQRRAKQLVQTPK